MSNYYVIVEEKLNLVPGLWAPLNVHVKQYDGDYTRQMKFTLYNRNTVYSIPSGSKVIICGTKPDGKGFSYEGTYSGSVVTVPLMRQMTIVPGPVPCEILLLDSNEDQIGSATFILDVNKAALQNSTLVSTNDFQTLLSYLDGSRYYEELSKSYAVGDTGIRDGEDVDNSKYYSQKARSYALEGASYVGSPLVATTASKMTDNTRIYVYTGSESGYTNGNWYYYDQSSNSWKSGGKYNSEATKIKAYNSVESMQADSALQNGMTAIVYGKDVSGDGQAALYSVVSLTSGETTNNYDKIALSDANLCADRVAFFYVPYVTPEMFGAVGDGVTDDSAAIQAAVDTGNEVVFGKNTYYVGNTITLLSWQKISGAGQLTKVITHDDISVFQINCQNLQTKYNCQITDMSIYGNGTETGCGIELKGDSVQDISDYHTFRNLYIEGFEAGIRILGRTIYTRFDCLDIWRCKYGIYSVTECFNTNVFIQVRIIRCTKNAMLLHVTDQTSSRGFKVKGCSFINCTFEITAPNAAKDGSGAVELQNSENNRFLNCWFEGNYENTPYSDVASEVMNNNTSLAFSGIHCFNTVVEGCIFQRTGGTSIRVNTNTTLYNKIGANEFASKCAYNVAVNDSSNQSGTSQLYSSIEATNSEMYHAGSGDHSSFVYSPAAQGFLFINSASTTTVLDGVNNKYIIKQIVSNFTITEIKGFPGSELYIECMAGSTGAVLTLPNSLGTLANGERAHIMYLGYPYNGWKKIS